MCELDADAIVWDLPETPPTSIDPLALTVPELVAAYRDLVGERDTYRALACEALRALHDLTKKCQELQQQITGSADA